MNNFKKRPETTTEALALASNMQCDLSEKLATYRTQSKRLRPDIAAAYDRLVKRLGDGIVAVEIALIGELVDVGLADRDLHNLLALAPTGAESPGPLGAVVTRYGVTRHWRHALRSARARRRRIP